MFLPAISWSSTAPRLRSGLDRLELTPASARSDRGRKLGPYLPLLRAQWVAGEHTIAFLFQTIRSQGYRGSETSVRNYLMALRKEIGPVKQPRRYYPAISSEKKRRQRTTLSSRRATWLVLRCPEELSSEDRLTLDVIEQAHPQVTIACPLAQAFAQMIRSRDAAALEPWLIEAVHCSVPELRTFATGIKRDRAAIQAAASLARALSTTCSTSLITCFIGVVHVYKQSPARAPASCKQNHLQRPKGVENQDIELGESVEEATPLGGQPERLLEPTTCWFMPTATAWQV